MFAVLSFMCLEQLQIYYRAQKANSCSLSSSRFVPHIDTRIAAKYSWMCGPLLSRSTAIAIKPPSENFALGIANELMQFGFVNIMMTSQLSGRYMGSSRKVTSGFLAVAQQALDTLPHLPLGLLLEGVANNRALAIILNNYSRPNCTPLVSRHYTPACVLPPWRSVIEAASMAAAV